MQIQTTEINSNFPTNIKSEIEKIQSNLNYQSIWQTIDWNLMVQKTGYCDKGIFVGEFEENSLKNYIILEKRSIGAKMFGLFGIGIIGEKLEENLEKELIKVSKKEKCLFIQIEPINNIKGDFFKEGYYKNFLEKHTAIINTTQTEEKILAQMKPKGRYNIRLAEKKGIKVEKVENTEENLEIYYNLTLETNARDSFNSNSIGYFREFLKYLYSNNLGGLYFAKLENEVIAAGIFLFYEKTGIYYYGASTSDNTKRNYMPAYLLQWTAILEAKNKGCAIYDFLGIADPNESHSHLAGVTDFKQKFTQEVKIFPKTLIHINNKFIYNLLKLVKKIKK